MLDFPTFSKNRCLKAFIYKGFRELVLKNSKN